MPLHAVERTERRLAAILAADVVSYSRLMGSDEEGTLRQLKAVQAELIAPKMQEHRGRLVKTTGDGMLAEFSSVVDAVRFATEVQRGMADRNDSIPKDRRILFRVGINLGDPVFRGVYHGKHAHEDDMDDVVQRALDAGCTKMMVTGSKTVQGGPIFREPV